MRRAREEVKWSLTIQFKVMNEVIEKMRSLMKTVANKVLKNNIVYANF